MLKRIIKSITYIILGLLLAFNLYNVGNFLLGVEVPSYFGYSLVKLEDDGMKMRSGDLVVIKKGENSSVRENELIVFKYDDDYAVSRVKYKLDSSFDPVSEKFMEGSYITQAEIPTYDRNGNLVGTNVTVNCAVSYSEVIGKVVWHCSNFGFVLCYFISWQFNILLLTVFVLLIWINIVIKSMREQSQEEFEMKKQGFYNVASV